MPHNGSHNRIVQLGLNMSPEELAKAKIVRSLWVAGDLLEEARALLAEIDTPAGDLHQEAARLVSNTGIVIEEALQHLWS